MNDDLEPLFCSGLNILIKDFNLNLLIIIYCLVLLLIVIR